MRFSLFSKNIKPCVLKKSGYNEKFISSLATQLQNNILNLDIMGTTREIINLVRIMVAYFFLEINDVNNIFESNVQFSF